MRKLTLTGTVLVAAGCSFAPAVQAQDDGSVASLREENARLKNQLQQLQERLNRSDTGAQPRAAATSGASSASTVPKTAAATTTSGVTTTADAAATAATTGTANAAAPASTGTATAAHTATPPAAASDAKPDDASGDTLGAVVVNARNRAEKLQDVPVPVSVIGSKTLEQDGAVTMADFAQHAAGIIVNPQNARQSSISIRGMGKQGATDAMESSVGLIVDNVFYPYGAYSWIDYVDLDNVQVLRGPQGTLLGKNTTLGVVDISTKLPSFTPEYTLESTVGSRDTFIQKATATGPLIDGLLAYRASVSADHSKGPVTNQYPDGSTYTNHNRYGGRLQLLFTPTADISARIILDKEYSNEFDNGGSILLGDPSTYANGVSRTANGANTFSSRLSRSWFGGYQPDFSGARQVNINAQLPVENRQDGISAEVKWNIHDYTLTSITAYHQYKFVARNDNDYTPFDIAHNFNTDATQWQASQELRLSSPLGGPIDYQVGVYALRENIDTNNKSNWGSDAGAFYATNAQYASLNSTAAGRLLMADSLNNVYVRQTQWPTTTSIAAYGQMNWHPTDKATITAGVRETDEMRDNSLLKAVINGGAPIGADDATAQKYFGVSSYSALSDAQRAQITNAIAIRNGQIGKLYGFSAGEPIHNYSTSWLLSPSYKLTDNILLYASASYGEKSGIVLFNTSDGTPQNAAPEKALDFELGFKSALLDRTLIFNLNLYQTMIRGYQQLLQFADPTQASGYRNVTGNVDKVQLRGVEVDSSYTGLKNFIFTFAGAYGSAIYKSFTNATCPAERSYQAVCDFSGRQLPGAAKLTANFGVSYSHAVLNGYLFHTNVDFSYRSRSNLDSNLSQYGWQKPYLLTNFGIGIGPTDGRYDVSLLIHNLFNVHYALVKSAFTATAPITEEIGDPRFVGIVFRARFI